LKGYLWLEIIMENEKEGKKEWVKIDHRKNWGSKTITAEFQKGFEDLIDGNWRDILEGQERNTFSGSHVKRINGEGEEL